MGGGSGQRNAQGRIDHGGRWRDEQEWPLARTAWTPMYLHADGQLSAQAPVVENAARSFVFDPYGNPKDIVERVERPMGEVLRTRYEFNNYVNQTSP